jgi:cleavage and polyadenylation specificity factor subunit 2
MGRVVCLAESESWRSEHLVESSNSNDSQKEVEEQREGTISKKGKEPLRGPFVPTLEEIHEAFDHIKAIRYNQPLHLGGLFYLSPCQSLS